MAKSLTGKQEKFCEGVASGLPLSGAYRAAYNCENSKHETINNKAYQLNCRDDIRARVLDLQESLSKKELWTREQSVKVLIKAVKLGLEQENPAAIAAVIDRLNKMHGYDASIKIEVVAKEELTPWGTITAVADE